MDREDLKKVREFGVGLAAILAILSLLRLWRGHEPHFAWFLGIGGAFLFLSLVLPRLILPVYRGWMVIARGLLWFNTRLILSLIFFLFFAPIGLVMRLIRKDLLDQRIERDAGTYWRTRKQPEPPKAGFKRQF